MCRLDNRLQFTKMAAAGWLCKMPPLTILWILLISVHICKGMEVTLLDTTKEDSLQWTTYPKDDNDGQRRGWREASFNTENGDTVRVYSVCNVAVSGVHNWLRTPYIERGDAHRLYIEVKFTMRQCTRYPEPGRLQQCKESFKLLYYETESNFANGMMPTWDTYTYHHLDMIAASNTYVEYDPNMINVKTVDVPLTRNGVYFAFYDQGACTMLLSVRIYYLRCPTVTVNYAVFPNTSTGAEVSSIVQQEGVCVKHAAIEERPWYLCKSNGQWYLLSGGCKCMPGYEPDNTKTKCIACSPGTYKWRTGSLACGKCPAYSQAQSEAAVECDCRPHYYRSVRDDKSMPCTKPPSRVRNVTVVTMDQSMVNVTWKQPEDVGGRRDLRYRVACVGCGSNVLYRPKQSGFNTTSVSLTGLDPSTRYKIVIYAENGVSDQSGLELSAHVIVTTEVAVPSKVKNLRIANVGLDYISVAWDPPSEPHSQIERYELKYFVSHRKENASSVYTKRRNITLNGLAQQTEYSFQVRGKTTKGWGEFSDPHSATTGHLVPNVNKLNSQSDNPVGIIAGSAVAVVVCMVIVIVMVIIFLRRNHRACNEKNVSDCDVLQYNNVSTPNGKYNENVQCPHVLEAAHIMNGGLTMPLFTPPGGVRTYVDPHTYEDPNQAVREFTKEIDLSCITIESVIGGGEFGDVCKGKLRIPGRGDLSVAIKTLKAGASDKNRLDFLTEASIMGQFDDPNVIYLEGVVTKSNPIMIVTEYMENGSLDIFLRNNDGKFTVIQLVGMLRGIVSGMRYLSDMGYVHRDLAARNILVNETLVCKVADFGLSREIESDDTDGAYTTKGGKIPVRWTAPEAIAYRKFTSASDVWSYGVVMWEVMSYGERPYWIWSNQDVIKAVDKGFRLPPPMDCPEAIHQLMLDCWQKDRNNRPKFSAIVKTIDKLIRAPELLRKIAKPRPYQFLDPNTPDLTQYESVEEWLTSIKMERYSEHFLQSGYTSMQQVSQITLKDLNNLGVTLVGHQKKIMNSVQTLRAQMSGAQVSEGFIV